MRLNRFVCFCVFYMSIYVCKNMGLSSSRDTNDQLPSSPTHGNANDVTSVLGGLPVVTTNVTPTTTIKRSLSTSHKNGKATQQLENHHVRLNSIRYRESKKMPDHDEINKKFNDFLVRIPF